VANCQPNCVGKTCGSDGCGGSCGSCGFGQECTPQFECKPKCTPNCLNKECGDNGCGGTCGICGGGTSCNAQGKCVGCTPDCDGKQCGSDGCGGQCGQCPAGLECYEAKGQCLAPGADVGPGDDEDISSYQDVAGGGDYEAPATQCDEGTRLVYGKCVPLDEAVDSGGDADSSCSMSPGAGAGFPIGLWLLLSALLCTAVRLRRGLRQQTP
jgi:hypothetical protein